jgi:DNA polymerase IV
VIRKTILELSDRVGGRLRREGVLAGGVTLKFRDHTFRTVTRAAVLERPTDVGDDLFREAWKLLTRLEWKGSRVRLVGVTAARLSSGASSPEGQLPLFPPRPDPKRDLARTVDKIRERFGGNAITRASLLDPVKPRKGRKQNAGREEA